MNWRTHIYLPMVCLLCCISCRVDIYDVPLPSEITKHHREALGQYISDIIKSDHENYPLLQMNDWNAPAFHLVQALYDQTTNVMRLDNKSPDFDKWSRNHWSVNILDKDEQIGFSIPGGDLFLSKGLLQSLMSESELYYLLTTEAILINERHLLHELINAYSTRTLVDLAEGRNVTDDRIESIEKEIPMFYFRYEISDLIKSQVTNHICQSSVYSPLMGDRLSVRLEENSQWLLTRPVGVNKELIGDCGILDSRGLYQSEVLDRLN